MFHALLSKTIFCVIILLATPSVSAMAQSRARADIETRTLALPPLSKKRLQVLLNALPKEFGNSLWKFAEGTLKSNRMVMDCDSNDKHAQATFMYIAATVTKSNCIPCDAHVWADAQAMKDHIESGVQHSKTTGKKVIFFIDNINVLFEENITLNNQEKKDVLLELFDKYADNKNILFIMMARL